MPEIGLPPPILTTPDVNSQSDFKLGLGNGFNEHFPARMTVDNLFNNGPPFMADATFQNNTGMDDIFGRSYYFSLSAQF